MTVSRRELLLGASALAGVAATSGLRSALAQEQKLDLLIKGGEVIDPSQGLRAVRDIGIRYGLVAAVEENIPAESAERVLDASGNIVTAGLVDMHAHVFPYGSPIGIPADELAPLTCTTTAISAGDAGANTFAALHRYVVSQSRTRILGFVHIANMGLSGFPVGEMFNIDHADVESCARTVASNPDFCLGVKVRESLNVVGDNGIEPLRRAIRAAEMAGPWARVMCHIGGAPGDISELLDLLRPGDIITHCFSGAGNNLVQEGKLVPAALAAQQRGVLFDVGHGGGSFDFTIAEPAMAQGLIPDHISSDIHVFSGNSPGKPYMPWVMSKFLQMGMSLEDVITRSTANPGKTINRVPKLGTLQVGAPGDVAVMALVEGPVTLEDTMKNQRQGNLHLEAVHTVRGGVPFGRPYSSPFSRT